MARQPWFRSPQPSPTPSRGPRPPAPITTGVTVPHDRSAATRRHRKVPRASNSVDWSCCQSELPTRFAGFGDATLRDAELSSGGRLHSRSGTAMPVYLLAAWLASVAGRPSRPVSRSPANNPTGGPHRRGPIAVVGLEVLTQHACHLWPDSRRASRWLSAPPRIGQQTGQQNRGGQDNILILIDVNIVR